ncbi:MFS transporter [Pilimelia columellifera]|uniref:MFS transporter n=1 Tax=Pilimelia columellifera subsp. columellifera TaxID=706583 RepID=A0ABN3NH40_9ACTN
MSSPLDLLKRNRDFRRLFFAEMVVFGADWFVLVPLLVLLPELTGDGRLGALVLAVDTGIVALLLPFTGTVADRLDRRKIMMVANVASIGGVLALLLVRSPATAWVALPAIAAVAVAKAFYSPAAGAALPNVVDPPDLPLANAVAGSAWGTMAVVGASLGGVISSQLGARPSFVIAAVALAAASAVTWLIRRPLQLPRDADRAPARPLAALAESLRFIGARPRVRALVTVKSAVGLGNGVLTVFPLLAISFGVGAMGTGLLFAIRGLGALVGPLATRRLLANRSWLLPGLAVSMSLYGLSYLGVAASPWFALTLVLVFVAHVAGGSNWVISNYALQQEIPDGLRGRVFATDMMLATLAISISQLAVGAALDVLEIRTIIAACGSVTLVYACGWWLVARRLPR